MWNKLSSKAALAVAVLALLACTVRQAQATTLADLTNPDGSSNGATFQSGDKLFSEFTFAASNVVGQNGTSGAPLRAAVSVIGVDPSTNAPGILFAGFSEFAIGGSGPSPNTADLSIGFKVTSLGNPIDDVSLNVTGNAVGQSLATVDETVTDVNNVALGTLHWPNGPQHITFTPQQVIKTQKDSLVVSFGEGAANVSTIQQNFSQVAVPAPAGVVLALTGLPVLGLGRWLRRRQQV